MDSHSCVRNNAVATPAGPSRPSVYLTSLVAPDNPTLERLVTQSKRHPPRRYTLTTRRREAEIVLFAESGYIGLESILKLRAGRKEAPGAEHFVFSESDWPFAYIPGLYCALTKPLPWAFSWAYLLDEREPAEPSGDQPYLYSFLGRIATYPVRQKVLKLDGPHTPCLDLSSAPERFPDWDYSRSFAQMIARSRFVLCPRGIGTSSIRLFEAMRAGRVPVIISDAWIEPPVGDWARFSLRVPENAVDTIPQVCEQHWEAATAMGQLARQTFDAYFSPTRFLDRALDVLRRATQAASPLRPANLVWHAAHAISGREVKTVAHRLLNAVRAGGSP
jgi:hypothetical protein